MIRRITLENYMAHGRTVIEPAAGLTVLVGPNNCGKSAITHALQTLCYNKPADFAVRHGEKEASVTVETNDGHVLTWRRKKNAVSYVIDGREVGRLGHGGVPEDLHRYLRMPRIDPPNENGAPFFVHFGLQKSPIFLLDDPPARAATFFASASDAEKLLEMQKRHREKVKDARRDHDRLGSEAAGLDGRLAATATVAELSDRVTQLEALHQRVSEADRASAARAAFLQLLIRSGKRREYHAGRVRATAPLQAPPRLAPTGPLVEMVTRIRQTSDGLKREKSFAAAVEPLQPPPALAPTELLVETVMRIGRTSDQLKREKSLAAAIEPLQSPPRLAPAAPLLAMVTRIGRLTGQLKHDQSLTVAIEPLQAPPAQQQTEVLQQLMGKLFAAGEQVRRVTAANTRLLPLARPPEMDRERLSAMTSLIARGKDLTTKRAALKAELLMAESAINTVKEQVQQWVAANPNCPTCGAITQAESVLEAEHQHA